MILSEDLFFRQQAEYLIFLAKLIHIDYNIVIGYGVRNSLYLLEAKCRLLLG